MNTTLYKLYLFYCLTHQSLMLLFIYIIYCFALNTFMNKSVCSFFRTQKWCSTLSRDVIQSSRRDLQYSLNAFSCCIHVYQGGEHQGSSLNVHHSIKNDTPKKYIEMKNEKKIISYWRTELYMFGLLWSGKGILK